MSVILERITFGVEDRFAHQARAQLQAKEKPGKDLPSLDPSQRARDYPTGTRYNRTCPRPESAVDPVKREIGHEVHREPLGGYRDCPL